MAEKTGLPNHVAVIMDGNGRWAEQRGLSRQEGHRAGYRNIRPVVEAVGKRGIGCLTLYAFSTENWKRPASEVSGIFRIMDEVMEMETRELHKSGIRIRHLGRLEGLTPGQQKSIRRAVKLTEHNTGLTLGLAINYGGRAEILDAVRRLISGGAPPELDEKAFGEYLSTAGLPDVDLVIRTGGEIRTSNFLIWQAAYSEYYFTPVLWPDFNEEELDKALETYRRRQRRFGALPGQAACSEKES
jgi:undecaprenyl diphosphate synthase